MTRGTNDARIVLRWVLLALVSVVTVELLTMVHRACGPNSVGLAFAVVWLPMMWLGTASCVVVLRLPACHYALRVFERDGHLYERLGVRLVKRLLRRGPLAAFHPDLHLPEDRSPEHLAFLDGRMREAEASHAILFVLASGLAALAHAVTGRPSRW
ncbi:MAG: hypothetical protein JW751_01905 [Polyangiaceae bacterium]|nr:hypothetical protein [Polyangiaceae bacterium]